MEDIASGDDALLTSIFSVLILSLVFGSLGVAVFLVFRQRSSSSESIADSQDRNDAQETSTVKQQKPTVTETKKKPVKESVTPSSHRLLLANLKGHTGTVYDLDFSSNGKFLASCAEDRTARLWNVKDFSLRDHKYVRANVEFDHATSVAFSPDSKAFLVSLFIEQTVRVFKLTKNKDGNGPSIVVSQEFDFPKVHKTEIIRVAIHASSAGSYVMTAGKDTTIVIWTTKGDVLEKVDTLLVYNNFAAMSPCGNLIAASGFTSDVKLWHVQFKNNEFKQVARAFELKGHKAGVHSFSFTLDSKRMASASKDGTWKIWDIDVKYAQGQDAYLLQTGSFVFTEGVPMHVALAPDALTLALAVGTNVRLYNAHTAECEEQVDEFHQDNISALRWYADSRQLVSSAGRSLHVWHNPVGARASLLELKSNLLKLKSESLMRNRVLQQIEETEAYISKF